MLSPQMMKLLIGYVESNGINGSNDSQELWKGYFYAVLLLTITMVQTILTAQYNERMFLIGMKLRTALTSTIYDKSLRMSVAARKESTMGEIVNLMSVDVQR